MHKYKTLKSDFITCDMKSNRNKEKLSRAYDMLQVAKKNGFKKDRQPIILDIYIWNKSSYNSFLLYVFHIYFIIF